MMQVITVGEARHLLELNMMQYKYEIGGYHAEGPLTPMAEAEKLE